MLEVEHVSRAFNGLRALSDVSLTVEAGELLGLIGPNGSGKSTLLNVISGIYPPDSGAITLLGTRIDTAPTHALAALGLARTFQTPRLYQRMTVRENLEAARHGTAAHRASTAATRADELLERAGLDGRADELATSLSLPEQRRLELIRAHVSDPKLVLLDEPAGGMTPAETADMAELIRSLMQPGQSCIVVEHKMDMIQSLCPRAVVLNFGEVICDAPCENVFKDPEVIAAYLGPDEVD